jgi:hypothetical protein
MKILVFVITLFVVASTSLVWLLTSGSREEKHEAAEEKARVARFNLAAETATQQPDRKPTDMGHDLRAGEQSEWIFVVHRWITILPNDKSVEYDVKDGKGNVKRLDKKELEMRVKDGKIDLQDKTEWIRLNTSKDIRYFVW